MASQDPQKSAEARESAGHGAKSEAVRERAILALMTERSIKAAARAAGLDEKTLRRWMQEDEAFKGELAAARRATYQAGMGRVQALTATAIETLEELMALKKYPSVRLGAARTVADLAMHQYDAEEIVRRLDEIEASHRQREGRR